MAYRISTKGESKRFYMEDLDSSRKPEPYPNQYIIAKEHSNGNILVLSVMGTSDGRPFPFSTSVGFPYTDFRDGNNSDATFASVQEVLDWFDGNTGFKRAGRSASTTELVSSAYIEAEADENIKGVRWILDGSTMRATIGYFDAPVWSMVDHKILISVDLEAGDYVIWFSMTGGGPNTCFVSVNGSDDTYVVVNSTTDYAWISAYVATTGNDLTSIDGKIRFTLPEGTNTISIFLREENTKLDKIYITKNGDTPS